MGEPLTPSFNVAPTEAIYAVAEHDAQCQLSSFRWGLLPWFAKDRKMAARAINARIETVNEKATFRDSFERRPSVSDSGRRFLRVGAQGEGQAASLHLCSRRLTAGACWVVVLVGGPRDRRAAADLHHHHRTAERPGSSPPRPDAGCDTARPVGPMAGWAPA